MLPILLGTLLTHVHADIDLGSVGFLSGDMASSPIPQNFVVGAVGIIGQKRYEMQDSTQLAIPGFVYFGTSLMYLGDRARYYFYHDDTIAAFGYARFRTGNLEGSEAPFIGLEDRKFELEGGVGINVITPYALLTFRGATDITGRTNGQEVLAWADFLSLGIDSSLCRDVVLCGAVPTWRIITLEAYHQAKLSQVQTTAYTTLAAPSPQWQHW